MKTNHLSTANRYIEKQITSLVLEKQKLIDKAADLTSKAEVLEVQIQGLYATKKSLEIKPVLIDTNEFITQGK